MHEAKVDDFQLPSDPDDARMDADTRDACAESHDARTAWRRRARASRAATIDALDRHQLVQNQCKVRANRPGGYRRFRWPVAAPIRAASSGRVTPPTLLGLLERFHRTLKDEEVYWRLYDDPRHARRCLAEFRERYNDHRLHWVLVPEGGGDPETPNDVYVAGGKVGIPKW